MTLTPPALAVLVSVAIAAVGCGGGDDEDLAAEDEIRNCMSEAGLRIEPPGVSPRPGLGSTAADFRALGERGVAIDVVVFGSARKAERAAADVQSALAGFGAGDAEVTFERNALAVFAEAPSDVDRATVEGCLAA